MENKKLTRPTEGRTLCGVCAGFAEYLNLDVTVIRLIYVLITFITGFIVGILGYLIATLIMPEKK